MSTDETLGKDSAPSAIRYLVLLSALTCAITAVAFLPEISGASTQEERFFSNAIPSFASLFIISIAEWFLLGRSRKMIGPYGIAFAIEILKTVLFNFATLEYTENVLGASTNPFLLLQITSLAIIFMLALTKVARTRIDQLAQKDITRNLLNLLPTVLMLVLLMGTYITEIAGLGTPRQSANPAEYTQEQFDLSDWNSPTWDATYLLENLLDQFTLNLNDLDTPLFNVTSDQSNPQDPVVYWRLGSLESYEYTAKPPYSTDWNPAEPTYKRVIPYEGNLYSQEVPSNSRTARFTIRVPMDYSDSIADVTVHQYFTNNIPTTWNGVYGSYVDSNSFKLYDSNSIPVTATTTEAREEFTYATDEDLIGIDANIKVDEAETSEDNGFLEYTLDYMSPNIQQAAAFSMTREESNYLECLDSNTWANIKNLYLQLPNTTGTLPDPCYVGGTTIANPNNNYEIWAPNVTDSAKAWNQPDQTVFGQAYYTMQQFENYTFDQEQWLAAETGIPADHPAEYEDYNEWFMRRGKGISLHFASAYATIMRLQGIPSRVVIGYLAGNDSAQYHPWRVVSSKFLHAWAEVLIPISTFLDKHVEWFSFDPLLSYLASLYGMELPSDVVPSLSSENQTTMIRPDYDLESTTLFEAILAHADALDAGDPNQEILERCIVNNSDFAPGGANEKSNLVHGEEINISVRLIRAPSLVSWLPYQNATIEFYIGTADENGTDEGFRIEDQGTYLNSTQTNSQGIATINVTIDISKHGIRTVNFYAVWRLPSKGVRKGAISLQYVIALF